MVEKRVDIDEAQRELGRVVRGVADHGDSYVIESGGEPQAVLVSFASYRRARALEEQFRRQEALIDLRRVKERVSVRNQDLGEADALELADRFVREVIDVLAAEGSLTFDRDG